MFKSPRRLLGKLLWNAGSFVYADHPVRTVVEGERAGIWPWRLTMCFFAREAEADDMRESVIELLCDHHALEPCELIFASTELEKISED